MRFGKMHFSSTNARQTSKTKSSKTTTTNSIDRFDKWLGF
jgi:hypothetical protein